MGKIFDLFGKFKDWLPGIGAMAGFLGFGKIQGIIVGVVATIVFFAGLNLGQKIGFREGYNEGKKAAEREDEDGGRRPWFPWREADQPIEIMEQAIPVP